MTDGVLPLFEEEQRKRVMAEAMDATRERVSSWYRRLPADWFDNPAPFPDGTSRREGARRFQRQLEKWQGGIDADGSFTLWFENPDGSGSAYGLRHQAYGSPEGGVRPVRARALTIPLTAKAQGRGVAQFESDTGLELFLVKKRDNPDPELIGTLCWEDEAGALHAAYALRTRSHLAPLMERRGHPAIPNEETLQEYFNAEFFNQFLRYG